MAQIRKTLGIAAGASSGAWRYAPRKQENQGAQIDLLFDRDDGAITICEIKYNEKPFVIDKTYAKNLLNKTEIYKQKSGTNKHLFLTMIASGGLKSSTYSEKMIDGLVKLEDLFVEIK